MIYQNDPQVVITREVRLSYVNLVEPRKTDKGGLEYQATLLIPKSDTQTIAEFRQAIDAAVAYALNRPVARGGWGGVPVDDPYACIMDGDGRMPKGKAWGPECAGHWVVRTKTKADKGKPFVVTRRAVNEPLVQVEPRDIYSGMYGLAQVRFGAYDNSGNRGVSCFIQGIFKTRDGEALSGIAPVNPEDSFAGMVAEAVPPMPTAPGYAAPVPPVAPQATAPGYTGGAPRIDPATGWPT